MTANVPFLLDPTNELSLTITIILFAWSTIMVWRGALLGARGHATPRVFVAVALTAGTVLNAIALLGGVSPAVRAGWSRGITWVLLLALGWTAITGVRYGRKVEAAFKAFDVEGEELHRDAGRDPDAD
jgi:hypothetical protein